MADSMALMSGEGKIYLRVPQNLIRDEVVVELKLPRKLAGRYIKMEVLPADAEDIPVKCQCKEESCKDCDVFYCPVHYGNAKLADTCDEPEEVDERPTIPGHPNCHYGECWDCHVMSCSIHLGWEDIPVEPQ